MAQFTSVAVRSDDDDVFAHPTRGSKLEAEWYRGQFLAALASAGVEGLMASALERRLLGVQDPGTKSPEPAPLSQEA